MHIVTNTMIDQYDILVPSEGGVATSGGLGQENCREMYCVEIHCPCALSAAAPAVGKA